MAPQKPQTTAKMPNMWILLSVLVIAIVILIWNHYYTPKKSVLNIPDYPLKVGNSWTYEQKILAHEENDVPDLLKEGTANTMVSSITKLGNKWHIVFSIDGKGLPFSKELWYSNGTLYSDAELTKESSVFVLPMVVGQIIEDDFTPKIRKERSDHLYQRYVDRLVKIVLLNTTPNIDCYVITNNVLSSISETTYCPGVGIVKEYYKHKGTKEEWEWNLVDYSLL